MRARLAAAAVVFLTAVPAAAQARVPYGFYGAVWDRGVSAASPAVQDSQWGTMAASGVESVRVVFSWAAAQPEAGQPPSFAVTDPVVARAAARRIALLPVVMYAPPWARGDFDVGSSPPREPGDYVAYLRALIGRYGPQGSFWAEHPELPKRPLRTWQVWNEPQLRFQWSESDWERGYGRLLRAARAGVRQADPGAKVVLAAMTNAAWDALASLYAKGDIKGLFDVATVHPYTGSAGRVLEVVRRVRAVLARRGEGRRPLWVTELAWPASRGRARAPEGLRTIVTNDRGMAERLTRAYRLLAKTKAASRVYWYTWASGYSRDAGIFDFTGLQRFDGTRFRAMPALRAYRASARRHQGCVKTRTGACRPRRG